MKYKVEKRAGEEALSKLNDLLNSMISDLHNIKGHESERQRYIYYRDLVWAAQRAFVEK